MTGINPKDNSPTQSKTVSDEQTVMQTSTPFDATKDANIRVNTAIQSQINADTEIEVYRPEKTQVVYSTLLDNSDIPVKTVQTQTNTDTITTTKILYDTADVNPPLSTQQPIDFKTQKQSQKQSQDIGQERLIKIHKSESLTDNKILAKSHQIIPTQDRLADETNVLGSMIEHLGVATKQWQLSVNWQRTHAPKAGLINQFKKKTEILDLDLSCLLCNRYGEVIERVWFKNVRDQAQSVRHHGDELLGSRSDTDTVEPETTESIIPTVDKRLKVTDRHANQERISLYFSRLPPHVFHLVFILSSYQGHPLATAVNGVCQLTDDESNVIHDFQLSQLDSDWTALRIATLTRSSDSWRYHTDMTPLKEHQLNGFERQISEELVRTAK